MRLTDGSEFPGSIFTINFCKGHGTHAVIGTIAGEIEPGNLPAIFIYRTDKGIRYHSKVLVILTPLVNAYQEENPLIAIIHFIQPDNDLFIVAIAGTCSVIACQPDMPGRMFHGVEENNIAFI